VDDKFECCVEGCKNRTDPRNTMYCTEHFFSLGNGAAAYPTEQGLNEQYLIANGWERNGNDGWIDPLTLVEYLLDGAMEVQEGRDLESGE
jgi:hypothetical protein